MAVLYNERIAASRVGCFHRFVTPSEGTSSLRVVTVDATSSRATTRVKRSTRSIESTQSSSRRVRRLPDESLPSTLIEEQRENVVVCADEEESPWIAKMSRDASLTIPMKNSADAL